MHYLIIFNNSILPIFLIILLAYIYNWIYKPDLKPLANLALALFAPVFVFDSLTRRSVEFSELALPFAFMLLLTSCLLAASLALARLLRLDAGDRNSFVLGASMINVGNFGLPLIHFSFGEQAVPLSIIYFVIFNIPLCTLAIYLSSDKTKLKDILLDVLRIPIFYAFLLALLFTWLQIPVPGSIQKGLQLISTGAIPLLIFILGLQLASISLAGLRHKALRFASMVSTAVFVRLVISPLAAGSILLLLSVPGLERSVAVLQTSAPSAILPLMYAIRFNKSPELLAAVILFSTLLSGLTLPIIISILQA
jgi:hypothetical protein